MSLINTTNRTLLSVFAGVSIVIMSPPQLQKYRGVIAAAFGAPGLVYCLAHKKKLREVGGEYETLRSRIAELEKKEVSVQRRLNSREQELEQKELRLTQDLQDLEAIKIRTQGEIAAARERLEIEGSSIIREQQLQLEKRLAEIADIEVQSQRQIHEERQRITSELLVKEAEFKSQLEQERVKLKSELEAERSEINRMLSDLIELESSTNLRIQREQTELETSRQILESEIEQKREILFAEIERERDRINNEIEAERIEIKSLQAELLAAQAQWEIDRQDLEREREEEFRAKLQEMEEASINELVRENEQYLDQEMKKRMEPHIKEMGQMRDRLKELTDRLKLAHEKIMNFRQPKKPEGMEPKNLIARMFIEFYERRGVYLDCENCYLTPVDVRVRVRPWEGVKKGDITGYFDVLVWDFKLQEPPQIGITDEGYEITMMPAQALFLGQMPLPAENTLFRGHPEQRPIELMPFEPELTNFDREAIAATLSQHDKETRMLTFVEPDKKAIPLGEIQPIELEWIEWLYNWREAATGQPCVRAQNDIIERVYGFKPGRATDSPREDGEVIRDRLHRIMDQLELKYTTKRVKAKRVKTLT